MSRQVHTCQTAEQFIQSRTEEALCVLAGEAAIPRFWSRKTKARYRALLEADAEDGILHDYALDELYERSGARYDREEMLGTHPDTPSIEPWWAQA